MKLPWPFGLSKEQREIEKKSALEQILRGGGSTGSGVSVTESRALGFAAFWRGIWLMSTLPAQMPLRLLKKNPEGGSETVDYKDKEVGHLVTLMTRPNPRHTQSEIKQISMHNMLISGDAYWLKTRVKGKVEEIIPLHPSAIKAEETDSFRLKYEYTPPGGGAKKTFNHDDIVHLRPPMSDGINGYSLLRCARESIGHALVQDQHGASAYKNGLNTQGFFKVPETASLTDDQYNRIMEGMKQWAGPSKAGIIPLLEGGLDYVSMGMTLADAQFLDSRRFSVLEMARWFGIPPHLLFENEGSTSWGTGLSEQTRGLVTYTLMPWLVSIEQSMGRDLLTAKQQEEGYFFKFNVDALLRGSLTERADAYSKMVGGPFMSVNWARGKEDQPAIAGGDAVYPPHNAPDFNETPEE